MSATIRARFSVPTALLLAAVWAPAGPSANADDPWPATWPAAGPADLKILAALDEPATMEFTDTPLRDVIDYLKDSHHIPIVIDNPALEEVGIGTDTPMTTNLKGVSLHSALKLFLDPLGLECLVRDEILLITTGEKADAHREVRVYDVKTLLDDEKDAKPLAELARSALYDGPTSPRVGSAGGGGGEMEAGAAAGVGGGFGGGFGGVGLGSEAAQPNAGPQVLFHRHLLIVRDTQQGHRRLAEFLAALRCGLEKGSQSGALEGVEK